MLNKVLFIFLVIVLFIIVLNRSQDIRRLILAPIGIATEKIVLSGTGSMYPTFPKGEGDDPQMLAEQTVATIDMYYFPSGFKIGGRDFFTRPL